VTAIVAQVGEMHEELRSSHSSAVTYGRWPMVGDDADPIAEALERHDVDLTFYLWNTVDASRPWPWAWVFLPECYPLASHVRSIREDASSMPFTLYGAAPDPVPPGWLPCVGAVLVTEKDVLRAAAARSPMFESAWSALHGYSPWTHWVCLSEPLDPAWVETVRDQPAS